MGLSREYQQLRSATATSRTPNTIRQHLLHLWDWMVPHSCLVREPPSILSGLDMSDMPAIHTSDETKDDPNLEKSIQKDLDVKEKTVKLKEELSSRRLYMPVASPNPRKPRWARYKKQEDQKDQEFFGAVENCSPSARTVTWRRKMRTVENILID